MSHTSFRSELSCILNEFKKKLKHEHNLSYFKVIKMNCDKCPIQQECPILKNKMQKFFKGIPDVTCPLIISIIVLCKQAQIVKEIGET